MINTNPVTRWRRKALGSYIRFGTTGVRYLGIHVADLIIRGTDQWDDTRNAASKLGIFWLAQRTGSPAWYRCWREGDGTQRISLGTSDFEEAKQRLTDWFILQVQPEKPASAVFIAEVIARYWNERGQFTAHPPTTKTHCNYWLDYFGEKSVEDAMEYAEQERFG